MAQEQTLPYLNETTFSGEITSNPTLGDMPTGTPVLSFTLTNVESFNDGRTGRPVARENSIVAEILGQNVSQYADLIRRGAFVVVKGAIRVSGNSCRLRVFTATIVKTYYDGYVQAVATLEAMLAGARGTPGSISTEDVDRLLSQLQTMRETACPTKPLSIRGAVRP